MGFYSNKTIAKVTEPQELTLSGNPNFIIFESIRNKTPDTKMELHITIDRLADHDTGMQFNLKEELSDAKHSFQSTLNPAELNTTTFLVASGKEGVPDRSDITSTAQNLLVCLRNNSFLRNNFDIYINPITSGGDSENEYQVDNGSTIVIRANGFGTQYNFTCELSYRDTYDNSRSNPDLVYDDIKISVLSKGSSSDTIDEGLGNTRIDLDIYHDTQSLLGDEKDKICDKGTFLTTLSKSYFGQPVWFELNALLNKKVAYSTDFFKAVTDWINTGTVSSFRVVARKQSNGNNQAFYYSHPLYVLNGYDALLSENDLKQKDKEDTCLVMDFTQNFTQNEIVKVRPLTTMYNRTHIKGQEQYFSFVADSFSDKVIPSRDYPSVALYYRLYTQSGEYISDYMSHKTALKNLNTINTAKLDLDRFLPSVPSGGREFIVGEVEVFLCILHRDGNYNPTKPQTIISTPLSFKVFPEYLYTLNDFAFLNRLGGWDTVNFSGTASTEFKTTAASIFKTLKPHYEKSSSIETVTNRSIEEQKIVQSAPMNYDGMEWLQQMSASCAVYELRSGRYILIDDMTLKYNKKDDLFQAEMKYHYTDSPR